LAWLDPDLTKPFKISHLQKNYLFNYPKLPSLVIAQSHATQGLQLLPALKFPKLPFPQPSIGNGDLTAQKNESSATPFRFSDSGSALLTWSELSAGV
jgi:hypothetical protein